MSSDAIGVRSSHSLIGCSVISRLILFDLVSCSVVARFRRSRQCSLLIGSTTARAYRGLVRAALYEPIPGGARWRYVWGSTLVMAFATQVITGMFLWMAYSPSTQTAWESVFYIQHEMWGGWLLRGIHHFMAQAMVVLLALHLLQVVWDGAYRAPRELNFVIGLVLMLIVLGLALTGYLLPWDQKGYWATTVATNLASQAPVVGPDLRKLAIGGSDYGHHTLTRFFALHAGVLPGLLVVFLAMHVALFRRHGLHAREPRPRRGRDVLARPGAEGQRGGARACSRWCWG